jgi:hypothetical protein
MLQRVKVDSKNGVILRLDNEKSNGENRNGHDKEEGTVAKNSKIVYISI